MAAPAPGPGAAAAGPLPTTGVTSEHLAAFRALQEALAADDDERAQGVVTHLSAEALDPRERELVASAKRVLTGRAFVHGLELTLQSEEVPERAGLFRLVLVARSKVSVDLRLALPAAHLKRLRSTIDARGLEGLELDSRASTALADLALAAGAERRVELWDYELPLGHALAVRERWRLEPLAGEIESGGVRYPAAKVKVASCVRERLSPLVPLSENPLDALSARLGGSEPVSARTLLELALRIPAEQRETALTGMAPLVARLAREMPERVSAGEPALRWLSENRDLGPDAAAWSRYLTARASAGPPAPKGAAGKLDLPHELARRAVGELR